MKCGWLDWERQVLGNCVSGDVTKHVEATAIVWNQCLSKSLYVHSDNAKSVQFSRFWACFSFNITQHKSIFLTPRLGGSYLTRHRDNNLKEMIIAHTALLTFWTRPRSIIPSRSDSSDPLKYISAEPCNRQHIFMFLIVCDHHWNL